MDIEDFKIAKQIQDKIFKYETYLEKIDDLDYRDICLSSIMNEKYMFQFDMEDEIIQSWVRFLKIKLEDNINSLEKDFEEL